MQRVRIIEQADELPQVRELWEECVRANREGTGGKAPGLSARGRLGATTLFQSYAWNEIAARVFAERERPYVVVAESDSGAAIIPACVRRDSVSLLGEELFDYRDVIACGDGAVTEAGWEKVRALRLPLEVRAVRCERDWAQMKPFAGAPYLTASIPIGRNKSLERNLRLLRERGCESGHRVIGPLDDRLAALAEALPLDCASPAATAPLGVTDRSGHRAIGSSGDQIRIPRCPASRDDKSKHLELVRRMYGLKARHESGSLFRDPLRIEAVAQMTAIAPTELFTLEHDGDLVAAVLTFIDGHVCRFYGTYYDARWARYSPGVSLLYRVIQQVQARGLDFDLMTGEQAYKMRFASEVVPLYIARVPVADRIAA